jgi:hypothetical protein
MVYEARKTASSLHEKVVKKIGPDQSEDPYLQEITALVFNSFKPEEPSEDFMLRLRPYLTHSILPAFIRLPNGAIETNIQSGLCDNASRMLAFILRQQGYDSVQWNMVHNSGGHSALLVKTKDDREVFLDPFYGIVAQHQNQLISLDQAQRIISKEREASAIKLLSQDSQLKFYEHLPEMFMAAEGQDLILDFNVPDLRQGSVILGEVDGQFNDVIRDGNAENISGYWHYIGHKYNREWVRELKAPQATKIVVTLADDHVDSGVITSNKTPDIEGNKLTWVLQAGETLVLRDGLAKVSWSRLNSYQYIDRVEFHPL